jgi:adenosine deaminase
MQFRRVLLFFAFVACFAQLALAESASKRLEAVRNDPLRLRRFLEAMPKGGDLHNHLSGDIYAESFMLWAANDGNCIDATKLTIVTKCEADLVPAASALTSPLYQQMLDALSMRQFRAIDESGHDHFFATFSKFSVVSKAHVADMLVEAVQRFGSENVDYLETIYAPDRGAAGRLGYDLLTKGADFKSMRDQLLASDAFKAVVADAHKTIDDAEAAVKSQLKCGLTAAMTGCDVEVRVLDEVHRGIPREALFAELVVGFELASIDPRVVGINPVMPEDGYLSMTNFGELMQMFAFLRPFYPNVRISTHAGELAPGLVPPEGLRFHIRDSVMIANANRIGHGVDIAYETDAPELLQTMAKRGVAVEICLTSNDVILGIRGKQHPLPMYLRNHVPVALASDDPGVSRIDLTNEFQRAVEEFGLTYAQLKMLARNSIEYSFLEGDSLFVNHDYAKRACSGTCDALIAKSARAHVQWKLEQRLADFEK